jgi:hypothetical protein
LASKLDKAPHQIPEPSAEDLERIQQLLRNIGGPNVGWGAQSTFDVWAIEQRARLDQRMSQRIAVSSWALVFATVGLVGCTAGLIWATLAA